MRLKSIFILIFALFLITNSILLSQSQGNRLGAGFNGGGSKYWGEFTDNQFWFGGDIFLRYNIFSEISIHATIGLTQIRYKTNDDVLLKYPDYFGSNANQGELYPISTQVTIQDKNSIRINTYELYLSVNLFSYQEFVPFIFGGIGMMNFEPRSGDTGYEGPLPNNSLEIYDKDQIIIPMGIGFEMYLTDNLVLNGRGTLRITGTDYLDDLSGTPEGNAVWDGNTDESDDMFLTFGIGLSYYILGEADFDKDGLTNEREEELGTDKKNPDTDGDGLLDGDEVYEYSTDPMKADTDDDKLNDYEEIFKYNTLPQSDDSDADGLTDGNEVARKTDPNNSDSDSDELLDGEEINLHFTDPLEKDTDGDLLIDGREVKKYNTNPKEVDSDKDGLADGKEIHQYKTNPAEKDTDQDGLMDGLELNTHGTDPNQPDTDRDGLLDGQEVNDHGTDPKLFDSDDDGLNDGDELKKYKTNPVNKDSDRDGLKDGEEINFLYTDPLLSDTDEDGLKDGDEVNKYNTNPSLADTDLDGLNDGQEILKYKTDPNNPDSDGEGLSDGEEVIQTMTDPNNPDTDGDNINDALDNCPHVLGVQSDIPGENGCPQAPKIGTKTDFPDILFVVDTDRFNYDHPGTARNLAKLLEYVGQCEGLQVMIEGHASSEGNDNYNQKLSEKRAKKVRGWLIEQGVSADKIAGFIGYGEREPKVKEPTAEALKKISQEELEEIRKQNRRITVEVTKTCDQGK